MSINQRYKNSKKQKNYSKYRIVSWKILGKLRQKGNARNQKPKWRFLRYSLLNMKDFFGNRKKSLGLKSSFKPKEDFRIKPKSSCTKKAYRESLGEVRKIRAFFGFLKIKVLKKQVSKYSKSKRSREKLLVNYLESRLDVVMYRMGFSSSVLESAKKIKKGFIFVNENKILKRNYQLNSGDILKVKYLKKEDTFFGNVANNQDKVPSYLEVNYRSMRGVFIRKPLKKELIYPESFCFRTSLIRLKK